jgi:hypothetical protein
MSFKPRVHLTPEVEESLFALITAGNFPEVACASIGLPYSSYKNWIKIGEGRDRRTQPSPEYIAFANRMREAEGKAEVEVVKMVVAGMPKDPALGLKFLARRFKSRWSETITHEISWVVRAVQMLQTGDVTLEALESTLPADEYELVRTKFLEAPAVDGDFVDIPKEAEVDASERLS